MKCHSTLPVADCGVVSVRAVPTHDPGWSHRSGFEKRPPRLVPSVNPMTTLTLSLSSLTLQTPDPAASERFLAAFGVQDRIGVRASDAPTTGFRGFTLSVLVAQPADADLLLGAAVAAGATWLKPAARSLWGYGGVVQAPDGVIWKVATSTKKDTRPASRDIEDLVLLLGVADVAASKRFYVEHGIEVARSFGRRYVEFDTPGSPVKLALYRRSALAKDAGVPAEGSGSHRILLGDGRITDPDGFEWEDWG